MNEKDFEIVEQAPTDINDVYEYEKPAQSSSRLKAGMLMTSGFVIFGALVGGGAFAMTGSLPQVLAPITSELSPAPSDAANLDGSNPSVGTEEDSASSEETGMADPAANAGPNATGGQASIVDPNAQVDPNAPVDSSASSEPSTTAPTAGSSPSSTSGTQVVVPPKFNSGDDEDDEDEDDEDDEDEEEDDD